MDDEKNDVIARISDKGEEEECEVKFKKHHNGEVTKRT